MPGRLCCFHNVPTILYFLLRIINLNVDAKITNVFSDVHDTHARALQALYFCCADPRDNLTQRYVCQYTHKECTTVTLFFTHRTPGLGTIHTHTRPRPRLAHKTYTVSDTTHASRGVQPIVPESLKALTNDSHLYCPIFYLSLDAKILNLTQCSDVHNTHP